MSSRRLNITPQCLTYALMSRAVKGDERPSYISLARPETLCMYSVSSYNLIADFERF